MNVIFHITGRREWAEAQATGSYRADSLTSEGFIHCSTADQVIETANRFFSEQRDRLLLSIDVDRLTAEVRYENLEGGEVLFPHLYGPLNLDAVVQVAPLEPDAGGGFSR